MFEHIVLRRATGGQPISAGYIAEALLYYQKLHLFIDLGTLIYLIRQLGTSNILTLLSRPEVSAVYCEEMLGTHTESIGVSQYHNFVTIAITGHEDVGKLKHPVERLQFELERNGISKKQAKQFSTSFLQRVPIRKFSGNHFISGGIPAAAKKDLLDIEYTKQAIRHAIQATPGGYNVGDELELEIIDSELGYYVFSNLDLATVNKKRDQLVPPIEPISIAYLLTNILDARADLALSAFYGGDFVTSEFTSAIIQARHSEFLRRSNINASSRQHFVEVVLPDSPSLTEVIDSGERSFDEFIKLLDRAERFKNWLKKVNPDEDLVRSYMLDISSEGWIQRLPAKSLRYVITQALDATSPGTGIIAGILDNFVVEKLLSGWRPNHFVTKRLKPFMQGY
jgi:hypothetical protein